MSRHTAREYLFKLTFEYLFNKEYNEQTIDAYLLDATLSDDDRTYIKNVYTGVIDHFDEIEGVIAKFADGYVVDRIYKPDLAAMIVSTYELKYMSGSIPAAVSINEAVDIVKKFSTEKSKSFVNGVLASVRKYLCEER